MKILLVGLIAFLGWSALSTYIYVCEIKELCDEPVSMQISEVNKDTIANGKLQKTMVEQTAIPKDLVIYFAFDKSDFNSNSVSDKYLDESGKYLNQNANSKLSITGYTDATGTKVYNQSLGYRRAQVMQRYFENKGILTSKITISSKGENEPADFNNTEAGRAKNRRTVVTIKK